MVSIRELLQSKYQGKEQVLKEITNRFGTMPYHPTLFSFWLGSFLTASGREKEEWFGLSSTEERLRSMQRFLEK